MRRRLGRGRWPATPSPTSPPTTPSAPASPSTPSRITASAGANGTHQRRRRRRRSTTGPSQTFSHHRRPPATTSPTCLVDGASVGRRWPATPSPTSPPTTPSAPASPSTPSRITASAGANGTITPPAAQTVNYGDRHRPSRSPPATGYHVADVPGRRRLGRGRVASYTFTNVTANHTISASFAINTFTHHRQRRRQRHASRPPSGADGQLRGQPGLQPSPPATGYHVADVLVDGVSVGAAEPAYTFTNVTANHTISASFAINTYTITPSAGANGTISPATAQTVNYGATPSLHHHAGDRLLRRRRARRRRLGRPGHQLHLHRRRRPTTRSAPASPPAAQTRLSIVVSQDHRQLRKLDAAHRRALRLRRSCFTRSAWATGPSPCSPRRRPRDRGWT